MQKKPTNEILQTQSQEFQQCCEPQLNINSRGKTSSLFAKVNPAEPIEEKRIDKDFLKSTKFRRLLGSWEMRKGSRNAGLAGLFYAKVVSAGFCSLLVIRQIKSTLTDFLFFYLYFGSILQMPFTMVAIERCPPVVARNGGQMPNGLFTKCAIKSPIGRDPERLRGQHHHQYVL